MNVIFPKHLEEISSICKAHQVKHLDLFGSSVSQSANNPHDIDFAVSFDDSLIEGYTKNFFSLESSLQKLFNLPVDLIDYTTIKNPILKNSIDAFRVTLYDISSNIKITF
ncbi:MAG: nucleotidyltransferase domain-containing protein [Chloroherpetonaceae bacterium]|nr:nucleotidyltransferase domain-containing protein [Chloroherpetonaceae bacterium]